MSNRNTGNWNTGYRNTGYSNTGNRNTGDWNTGNSNTGNWNTGYSNTGNRNTGYWNTGDWNTGMFNTDEPTVRMFNKDTGMMRKDISIPEFMYFNLTSWIPSEDMTDKEKEDNQSHTVTGGYLKVHEYQEAFKKAWNGASKEDQEKVKSLPNFDAVIFKEISGIDVNGDDSHKADLPLKADELIAKAEELKEQARNI